MDPFGRVRSQDLSENEVDTRNDSTNRDEKVTKWLNEPLQENAIDRIKMTQTSSNHC